jgi:predicted dehydrogenase
MIGCGSVAEVKSGPGLYKAGNSTLLAVSSAHPERARSYAERHGVPRAHATAAALLADPDIDAVYIATPPSSHRELAIAAAAAGKHIYLEKPMAMRFAECQEVIDACARHGVRLFVAYYRRAMQRFVQVKRWLEEGRIGQVLAVRLVQHQPPAPEELSPASLPWRVRPEIAGGGKFLDMGVHALDMFDFWFGPIVEVRGIAVNQRGLYPAEDTVAAIWRHAGGVPGSGFWCFVSAAERDEVQILGTEGSILLEFFSDRPLSLIGAGGEQRVDIANPPHVQQPFIQTIVDELNGVGRCPGDPASAARTSRIADEVLAGWRSRLLPTTGCAGR